MEESWWKVCIYHEHNNSSLHLQLTAPTKKEFLGIQNGKSQFLKAGDTMVLQCLVKLGFIPLQSVRWFKDGVKLELGLNSNKTRTFYRIDDRLNSSQVLGAVPQARLTLIIANVSVKDSGTYTCKATENLNKTVAVTVKGEVNHHGSKAKSVKRTLFNIAYFVILSLAH